MHQNKKYIRWHATTVTYRLLAIQEVLLEAPIRTSSNNHPTSSIADIGRGTVNGGQDSAPELITSSNHE